jgi:hypothetical protein
MWKSAGRASSLRVFTLAFALQLRKKHGKTTVRVRETSVRLIKTSVRVSIHSEKVLGLLYKTIVQVEVTCVAFISVRRSEILQKLRDLCAVNNACVYSMGWLGIGTGGGHL